LFGCSIRLETVFTVDTTILLVETDPAALTTLDELFFDLGCFVDLLSSGQEALEYLRQNTPTIAMLSADMTDPSGLDVCFRIKRIRRLQNLPVVILSSIDDDRTRDFAQTVKADVFLPKPLEPELLRAVIEELIARATAEAGLKNTSETVILDFNG
jgi:DNA-binding response OmpR family regulator